MNSKKQDQRTPRVGIDIGRVIIAGGGTDTSFFGRDEAEALRRTPAVPGAFAAVTKLVERFEGQAFLVSKCGPRIRGRSMAWLDHHDFWAQTKLPREQVRFCRERQDKAIHARELGLTHFVDDRFDVLIHLIDLVEHLYLFGPQRPRGRARGRGRQDRRLARMIVTPSWSAALEALDGRPD